MALGTFSHHARHRMAQRKISEDEVDQVLLAPDRAEPDPDEQSVRLEKQLPNGVLKVWVVAPWPPPGGRIIVKSAAWKRR